MSSESKDELKLFDDELELKLSANEILKRFGVKEITLNKTGNTAYLTGHDHFLSVYVPSFDQTSDSLWYNDFYKLFNDRKLSRDTLAYLRISKDAAYDGNKMLVRCLLARAGLSILKEQIVSPHFSFPQKLLGIRSFEDIDDTLLDSSLSKTDRLLFQKFIEHKQPIVVVTSKEERKTIRNVIKNGWFDSAHHRLRSTMAQIFQAIHSSSLALDVQIDSLEMDKVSATLDLDNSELAYIFDDRIVNISCYNYIWNITDAISACYSTSMFHDDPDLLLTHSESIRKSFSHSFIANIRNIAKVWCSTTATIPVKDLIPIDDKTGKYNPYPGHVYAYKPDDESLPKTILRLQETKDTLVPNEARILSFISEEESDEKANDIADILIYAHLLQHPIRGWIIFCIDLFSAIAQRSTVVENESWKSVFNDWLMCLKSFKDTGSPEKLFIDFTLPLVIDFKPMLTPEWGLCQMKYFAEDVLDLCGAAFKKMFYVNETWTIPPYNSNKMHGKGIFLRQSVTVTASKTPSSITIFKAFGDTETKFDPTLDATSVTGTLHFYKQYMKHVSTVELDLLPALFDALAHHKAENIIGSIGMSSAPDELVMFTHSHHDTLLKNDGKISRMLLQIPQTFVMKKTSYAKESCKEMRAKIDLFFDLVVRGLDNHVEKKIFSDILEKLKVSCTSTKSKSSLNILKTFENTMYALWLVRTILASHCLNVYVAAPNHLLVYVNYVLNALRPTHAIKNHKFTTKTIIKI